MERDFAVGVAAIKLLDLVLIGASGTCADVLAIIAAINRTTPRYRCVGVLDDNMALHGTNRFGLPVLGSIRDAGQYPYASFVDCLGSPSSYSCREAILFNNGLDPNRFETLIAPSAFIADSACIGTGSIIYPNAILMAGVSLGSHVTVLANVVLNHHAQVADFGIIASGANISGQVRLGRACYVGAGASLIQGIVIGDNALVGAGSVVIRDVLPNTVVVGNPARWLKNVGS